jgi:uncharacterized iron-regulated protein
VPTPLLLLGEQHDAPEHQTLQRASVAALASRGQLAGLVLEMIEDGLHTAGLPRDADETRVRAALDWRENRNAGGWEWSLYGPVVMAAVRAGAPVHGGNLPRADMRGAMVDTTLDSTLPADALQRQQDAIREGHCQMVPATQIPPMTRIQIARDRRLALRAISALQPGRTVLLIAGNGHVQRDLGVPRHLPPGQAHRVVMMLARQGSSAPSPGAGVADRVWHTPPRPPTDHCASLRKQLGH